MVNIEAPNTYSLDDSALLAETIEERILSSMDEQQELKSMLTNVGVTLIDFNRLKMGSHYIQIIIDLEKAAPKGFIENYVSPVVNLKFSTEGTRSRSTE